VVRAPLLIAGLLVACVPAPRETPPVDDSSYVRFTWDPAPPPDVREGSTLVGTLTCGLFESAVERAWIFDGDALWVEAPPEGEPTALREELLPCMEQSERTLTWDDDGRIEFEAAGWEHVLDPSPNTPLWFGEGEPRDLASAECLAGLRSVGLELPVRLSLSDVEVLP